MITDIPAQVNQEQLVINVAGWIGSLTGDMWSRCSVAVTFFLFHSGDVLDFMITCRMYGMSGGGKS